MRRWNMRCTGLSATDTQSQCMTCQILAHVTADLFVRRDPRRDLRGLDGFPLPRPYSDKTTSVCFFILAISWTLCRHSLSLARRLVTGLSGVVPSRAARDSAAISCVSIRGMLLEPWRTRQQSKHFSRVNFRPETPAMHIQFSPIAGVLACLFPRRTPP